MLHLFKPCHSTCTLLSLELLAHFNYELTQQIKIFNLYLLCAVSHLDLHEHEQMHPGLYAPLINFILCSDIVLHFDFPLFIVHIGECLQQYNCNTFKTHTHRFNVINFDFFLFSISEEQNAAEAGKSPIIGNRSGNDVASPGSVSPASTKLSPTSTDAWPAQSDEDIDRLVALHRNRSSLGSLGVSFCFFFHFSSLNG